MAKRGRPRKIGGTVKQKKRRKQVRNASVTYYKKNRDKRNAKARAKRRKNK